MNEEDPERIRFEGPIQPVHSARSHASDKPEKIHPLSEKTFSVDDEEKARKIAEQDLNTSHKQTYSGFVLLWLSWQATGVIYGDIGTSPLYVYSSTFSSQPSWDDLVGALSIIIWSLTLIVTVKYTFIVLSADDDGQGGTFALYSLLSRYINITKRDPNTNGMLRMQRYKTGDMRPVGRSLRSFLENSSGSQFFLKVVGVLGVSLVMADGVLTPAQSVLGAIQGIRVVNPDLGTDAIVGISCAILVLLFFLQPFGTSKIGTLFAPIVVVWLLFNLCSGIYNLVIHDYTVLKAFSPYFAFSYLKRNGHEGWRSLGGLLLAFTGVEALFADIGAFGKRAIQISWLGLAYPCLLMAYAGQAAFISSDADETAFTNPFFYTVPPGSLYFSLVIAILAAIVASQAMITSTFQLLSQVMRLSYFPHIKVVHTSKTFHEQVYMPLANWLLMIGTVIVTAVYNNTTSLGNAYGVCVIFVTFITTCMVTLVALLAWRLPSWLVLPIFLLFGALDGVFLTSVLTKVPDGAWFTLLLAAVLSSVFILWRYGKENQWAAESTDRLPPSGLLEHGNSAARTTPGAPGEEKTSIIRLTRAFGGTPVSVVPGLGIFFDKNGGPGLLPPSFAHFVRKFAARPAVVVFFHMRPLPVPSVPHGERFVVTRLHPQPSAVSRPEGVLPSSGSSPLPSPARSVPSLLPNCYAVVMRHGYTDDVLRPGMARELVAQIELAVSQRSGADAVELAALREAHESQVVYVLGKETMRVKRDGAKWNVAKMARRLLLGAFLWIRENTRAKLADLDIDVDKLVEVGFLKEI